MFGELDKMIAAFERGALSRRQLVQRLGGALAAAASLGATRGQQEEAEEEIEAPSFQSRGLNHLALRVSDVPRSRDFYVRQLGLEVVRDGGQGNCFLRSENHFLALFRGEKAGMDHYCWTIDDYEPEKTTARLTELGLKPRREQERVYFKDPDGLTVQLSAKNDFEKW